MGKLCACRYITRTRKLLEGFPVRVGVELADLCFEAVVFFAKGIDE